ncbi:O-antigen ligase family protein [Rhizobium leguminosarum bv. viciae]|uniref:O-antigen ligase family protein n=1 Tax=Rhizobium TaxID=379 RepID=UPI00103E85FD|nr:O-antigen ligase family protein [Rhizobium leguminosarum]MBY5753311.1 O-antigen ligase family protein [Rhizobium leguminosarum]NKM00527.1 O-antigen ligase family protein [Rhizobium leguminosarum bv. viciae]TBY74967.1 O-antigen ligase family protein [Rhizobium leguminosarum bv. viciae]TCA04029.1 O-antigen ligase family protein [Rhizobium leguminosarum bv. viciae]UFW82690.1 O-antigen ligase family protein [Rhizobium leguminosarum bv. viciae]
MRAYTLRTANGPTVSWRAIECWGAGLCLFLQTGALFPLMLADADGGLSDHARSILRLLCLPVYGFTLLMLARNSPQFIIALKRNWFVPLMVAIPFVSVFWSVGPSTTFRRAIGLLFTVLLAYVLAIRFTPRQLLLIAFATFGTCIVLSLLLLLVSPGLARMPTDSAVRGIFIHKNSLGWYAGMMILVSTAVVMDGNPGLRRAALILLMAGGACLFLSGSMTATIATVSAYCLIGFYSMLQRIRGVGRIVFILFFVQIFAGILLLLHEFLVPFLEALGKDATLTGRVPLWELVDGQIADHLLLGFGYQAFWTEANPEAWIIWSKIQWMAPHAHNGFRDTLLSFGASGMTLFALMLLQALRQGAALQCEDPRYGWLWLNVFTVVILVMNLTETIFLIQNDAIFILFTTAIIMFSLYKPVVVSTAPGRQLRAPARSRTAELQIS